MLLPHYFFKNKNQTDTIINSEIVIFSIQFSEMGKTGARKRVAAKKGELPFNVEDRVQHQIRKRDRDLLDMYLWHVEQLGDRESGETLKSLKLELKQKDGELAKMRENEAILRKKAADGEEASKTLEQLKELLNITLASQYCQSKRNVWLVNKAEAIGVLNPDNLRILSNKITNNALTETLLVNPILDLMIDN